MAERVRARVFGEVADEYDRIRPGYPAALVDDVLDHARLAGAPALEVGAGTGRATVAFAERGVAVTALEPDGAMAEVLRRRVADRPDVTVAVTAFEDYRPARPFGLLFSAQAWHWTEPAVRWRRAAAALAPGGTLALFWNGDRPADPEVTATLLDLHRRRAPQILPDVEPVHDSPLAAAWPREELVAQTDFGDLSERLYRWERTLTAQDYTANLSTHSAYRMLDEGTRVGLFRAITDVLGERIVVSMATALYLARRLDN
ncbi:class I SAM-dependent methyltransferase [Polymorphospora lycopeni]|uniref:Class I SAM-dependent methyltransferase n=1 Tax=Polymorphospora lycopeni TaxID=3140240 RepID=A0ABV5CYD1_9ACTN